MLQQIQNTFYGYYEYIKHSLIYLQVIVITACTNLVYIIDDIATHTVLVSSEDHGAIFTIKDGSWRFYDFPISDSLQAVILMVTLLVSIRKYQLSLKADEICRNRKNDNDE